MTNLTKIKYFFLLPTKFYQDVKDTIYIKDILFLGSISGIITAMLSHGLVENHILDVRTFRFLKENLVLMAIYFGVIGFASMIFTYFLGTLILKVICFLLKEIITIRELLQMTLYCSILTLIGSAINAILCIITGQYGICYTSLDYIIKTNHHILNIFLGEIEIFSVWSMILMFIMLKVMEESKLKRTITCILFFLVSFLIHLGSGNVPTRI